MAIHRTFPHSRVMKQEVGLIGFGEAGFTLATTGNWGGSAFVFDIKATEADTRAAMLAAYARAGVQQAASLDILVGDAALLLSLVTADKALSVAQDAAASIAPGALFCDFNSVAPTTKQAAARAIEGAGGHYVDVAMMAPVAPPGVAVPLLLSGPQASRAQAHLAALGFTRTRIVGADVGRASSIKMIRSVMVKGIEALTAECMIAADAAGVLDELLSSLDASEKAQPWADRADYNLDRMMVHGLRRAAEMEEVVKTLDALGTGSVMTRGVVERQRAIGSLAATPPPEGLKEKLQHLSTASIQSDGRSHKNVDASREKI